MSVLVTQECIILMQRLNRQMAGANLPSKDFDVRFAWREETKATPPYPLPRELTKLTYSTVTLVGGYLFVYGGVNRDSHRSSAMLRYNVANQLWIKFQSPPGLPVRSMHSCTLVDDALYIYGGFRTHGIARSEEATLRYDIVTNTCEIVQCQGDLPGELRGHRTEYFEHLKSLLLYGGQNRSQRSNKVFRFVVAERRWIEMEVKGQMPRVRSVFASASVGKRWYVCGGQTGHKMFVLDLRHRVPVWSELAAPILPSTLIPSSMVHMERKLIVLARSLLTFDLVKHTWHIAIDVEDDKHEDAWHRDRIKLYLYSEVFATNVGRSLYVFGARKTASQFRPLRIDFLFEE